MGAQKTFYLAWWQSLSFLQLCLGGNEGQCCRPLWKPFCNVFHCSIKTRRFGFTLCINSTQPWPTALPGAGCCKDMRHQQARSWESTVDLCQGLRRSSLVKFVSLVVRVTSQWWGLEGSDQSLLAFWKWLCCFPIKRSKHLKNKIR